MRRPIITTDLDFARDICQDAAKYFRPNDHTAAAEAIIDVYNDKSLEKRLIEAGEKRLIKFGTPKDRLNRIMEILKRMVSY